MHLVCQLNPTLPLQQQYLALRLPGAWACRPDLIPVVCSVFCHVFAELDLWYTDLAQHLIAAGWDVDDLDTVLILLCSMCAYFYCFISSFAFHVLCSMFARYVYMVSRQLRCRLPIAMFRFIWCPPIAMFFLFISCRVPRLRGFVFISCPVSPTCDVLCLFRVAPIAMLTFILCPPHCDIYVYFVPPIFRK